VAQFKYLAMTARNQNLIHVEIKSRIIFGDSCCHSVQNHWSIDLLSTNVKIKIYKTIILPVVLYGCETWSLILKEEHRLKVFENRVLRRIFGPKRDEIIGSYRKLHAEDLHYLYSSSNINRVIIKDKMGRACSTNWGEEECIWDTGGKARRKETTRKTKS
jgi:hypothetical protein